MYVFMRASYMLQQHMQPMLTLKKVVPAAVLVVFVRPFFAMQGFEPWREAQVNMPFRTLTQAGFTVYKELRSRADTVMIHYMLYLMYFI